MNQVFGSCLIEFFGSCPKRLLSSLAILSLGSRADLLHNGPQRGPLSAIAKATTMALPQFLGSTFRVGHIR